MNEETILRLIGRAGAISGKKAFQKLCYFLQEGEGENLGVRFRMRHYGPFSQELDLCLEDMAERRLVVIADHGNDGYRISLRPEAVLTESPEADTGSVGVVWEKLGRDGGLTLEVLATAHFLAGEEYTSTEDDKKDLVDRVVAWKGRKFSRSFIRENIDRLERLDYLAAAQS